MLKPIPSVIRDYVYKRDKGKCRICRKPVSKQEAHVHHLWHRNSSVPADLEVPRVKGNNHPYNLILVCSECHATLHSGKDLPLHLRRVFVKWNKEMEYLFPFPEELKTWLEKNTIEVIKGGLE